MISTGLTPKAAARQPSPQVLGLAVPIWIAVAVFECAPAFLTGHRISPVVTFADAACSVIGVALSWLIALLAQSSSRMTTARRTTLAVLGGIVAAGLLVTLDASIVEPVADLLLPGQLAHDNPSSLRSRILDFTFYLWIFEFYATVVLLLESNRLAEDRARRLAEADAAAKAAQLSALRFQLNPHFLFNTLNALSALVVTGRLTKAELMIERLSAFLRTTLASGFSDETDLQDELGLLESYLEIESVRFGDRFAYAINVPPPLLTARVPSLILQPLAENSIKYAVAPAVAPVRLQIEAFADRDHLVLVVDDDGCSARAPEAQPGARVGLRNVAARLRALYGADALVTCQATDAGFRTELRLPLVRLPAAGPTTPSRVESQLVRTD